MSAVLAAFDFFPVRYRHAVWSTFIVSVLTAFYLEGLTLLGYLSFFMPLAAPAAKSQDGYLRRIIVGYLMLLSIWMFVAVLAPGLRAGGLAPSLCVAGVFFVFLATWRSGPGTLLYAALGAVLATLLSVWATERQQWPEMALGLIVGGIVYRLAFSASLEFIDHPHPWSHGFNQFRVLFIDNRKSYWEDSYAAGEWQYLKSDREKPRHYAIAGIIRDRFPGGADILDLGCGYGTLYPLIKTEAATYVGVDLAESVIEECRTIFKNENRCRFETCALESYSSDRKFDVVILNEVIYLIPFKAMSGTFSQVRKFLKDDKSILVVSMAKNPKSAWTRRRLSQLATPIQSHCVSNERTAGRWTIDTYQKAGKCA